MIEGKKKKARKGERRRWIGKKKDKKGKKMKEGERNVGNQPIGQT
jgi:hypothetical protein